MADVVEQIDDLLTGTLGLHGGFVLAVETYDEAGEPSLEVIRNCPTIWQAMGLIEAARESTLIKFREPDDAG